MPTEFKLPSCLMDCYTTIYPKLNFSRVGFYSGLPFPVNLYGRGGFTMCPGGWIEPDIHVYIPSYDPNAKSSDTVGPCNQENFLTIAHELVHVIQIQGMIGGGHIPGSWAAYYASHALGCWWRGSACRNDLEKEAYDFANGCPPDYTGGTLRAFVNNNLPGEAPCTGCPTPTPTPGFLDAWMNKTAAPVKTSSNVGRTWCSLLTFPLDIIAGVYSIFGFHNTGGAIGAMIGAIGGAILGLLGGGPLGAILSSLLGALIGGAVGSVIGSIVNTISSWF